MRSKTIFLIVALAMLMLAGVAWAEDDDDQGENDDFLLTCPNPDSTYLIIIQAPSSTYLTIADIFQEEGGVCLIITNKVKVKSCIDDECAKADGDGILASIAAAQAATISSTVLACAVCGPEAEDQADIIIEELRQTQGDGFYDRMYKKWITGTKWKSEPE